ncbi:GNAT family N-acetyltransferase [Kurthia sibirica]|nr:GNAT family N-acetyltransferase [Kurthia sibirica]GEK34642.1 N-acetyltransferase [Kurthia sibirica]
MNIRPLTAEDLSACTELFLKVFTQPPWNDQWTSTEAARIYLEEYSHNPVFLGFILEENNCIVGASFGNTRSFYTGVEYCISEYFIDDRVQHSGYGTFFMQQIEKELIKKDIHIIALHTERDTPAEKFYAKLGFTASDMNIFYYKVF